MASENNNDREASAPLTEQADLPASETPSRPPSDASRPLPSLLSMRQNCTSLFVRQALLVFVTVAGTVLILSTVGYKLGRRTIREQIGQRLLVTCADRATMLEMFVDQQRLSARLVATRTRLRELLDEYRLGQATEGFEARCREILVDAKASSESFREIWIADPQGTVIAADNPARLKENWADDADFRVGLKNAYLGEPREDGYVAFLTGPIRNKQEVLLGVLMIRVDLHKLKTRLSDPTELPSELEEDEEILVGRPVDGRFRLLFASSGGRREIPIDEAPALEKATNQEKGYEVDQFLGEEVLVAYYPIQYQNDKPWGMIAKIPARDAFAPMTDFQKVLLLTGCLLLLPALAAAYALANYCARPIMHLADSAAKLAQGDFGVRVPVESNDEIGRLSTAFNDMAVRLQGFYDTLERKVQERTAELSHANEELKRSNRDLQQFAYVASHDLQEPLRAISGFTELLQDEYGPQLDARAREYMEFTTNGAHRMKLLIDNLLEYARVESQGRPFEHLDSQKILQQAVDNLSGKIKENDATVTADGLGPVIADGTQLTQVFQNLIGNAIKFRGSDPPEIRVGAEYREGEVQFSVCDNGIGIDPRHHERVFTVFQRLHSQDQYPGTGIGLAICYRIVQRHGGRIWVESDGGPGCCFRFTLPQPPRAEAVPDDLLRKEEDSS